MSEPNLHINQKVSPKVLQRTVLLGRVKMAQAIKMPESEWAKVISDIEKDPLIRELLTTRSNNKQIIHYKRNRHTGISGQFYEMQDAGVIGGSGQTPEALLDKKKHLLKLIEKVGQARFEKFFLYREQGESLDSIANQCEITTAEAKQIQDFILDMSVEAEFLHPSSLDSNQLARPTLVGKIIQNQDGSYSVSFFSPHMARGQYEINHDALKSWQKNKKLNRQDAARVRKFVGMLELANLKQGAFWRVMEYLLVLHKEYFDTQNESKMAPVSLRKVAKHLQFAPSTISRVMGNKSVILPWGHEVRIMDLMPGQRRVVLSILDSVLSTLRSRVTDAQLAKMLAESHGVRVSRRTITACRNLLESQARKAA